MQTSMTYMTDKMLMVYCYHYDVGEIHRAWVHCLTYSSSWNTISSKTGDVTRYRFSYSTRISIRQSYQIQARRCKTLLLNSHNSRDMFSQLVASCALTTNRENPFHISKFKTSRFIYSTQHNRVPNKYH